MGKIPPALRTAISSNNLLKTPAPTQALKSPHQFLYKNENPSKKSAAANKSEKKTPAPAVIFKSPELSEAIKIFNSLVTATMQTPRKGCSPNSCTYNTLLYGLCKSRLMEKGIELYRAMKEGGVKLETAAYATLVRALCRHGKVAEAYEVFDYAVESKSLTDVAAYTTLESTLKWLKKAKEQGHAV